MSTISPPRTVTTSGCALPATRARPRKYAFGRQARFDPRHLRVPVPLWWIADGAPPGWPHAYGIGKARSQACSGSALCSKAPIAVDEPRRPQRCGTPDFEQQDRRTIRSVCSTMRRLLAPALPEMRSSSKLHAEAAKRLGRLVDDRQERRQHGEMLDIVEADQTHIAAAPTCRVRAAPAWRRPPSCC